MMKIALIGYGKMGRIIEECAQKLGHQIIAKISSKNWEDSEIATADICIEFTNPESALDNIRRIAKLKKPLIIGTTGWDHHLDQVTSIIDNENIGAVYSSNFSLGMNLFKEIVDFTSKLLNPFPQYDIAGIEYHHHQKKDRPSGSAKALSQVIEKNIDRIDQLPFSSIRCGSISGTHTILLDSSSDSITLTHDAKNREGFALGVIQAAEWLKDKKGLYPYSQCVQELIKGAIYEKV